MKYLASFISLVFHPIFMPTIGVLLVAFLPTKYFGGVFGQGLSEQQRFVMLMMMLLFTVLFPLCHLTLLYLGGNIKSFHLRTRKERIPAFIGTIILYLSAYIFLKLKGGNFIPTVYYSLMLGGVTTLMIATIVTFKWKISIHAIGISGVTGTLVAVNQLMSEHWLYAHEMYKLHEKIPQICIGLMLLMGVVGTARIIGKNHNLAQVIAGYILGFSVMYCFVLFGVKI